MPSRPPQLPSSFHSRKNVWVSGTRPRPPESSWMQRLSSCPFERVQKYAHLAPSHVAAHANTVNFLAKSESENKIAAGEAAITY